MTHKILLIFDKSTIINFRYIFELINRYRYLSITILSVVTAFCWHLYFSQETVYLRESSFTISSSNKNKTRGIQSILESSGSEVSLESLRALVNSWEFKKNLLVNLASLEIFDELVLISNRRERVHLEDISSGCQKDLDCIEKKAIKFIGRSYNIIKNKMSPGYSLLVHSFDEKTARVLQKEIRYLIGEMRAEELGQNSSSKVETLSKMLDEKQRFIGSTNLDLMNEQTKVLEGKISDIEKSIEEIQLIYNRERAKLFEADLKYKELNKIENLSLGTKDREKVEELRALESKIGQLNENIDLLKISNASGENSEIIGQLKKQVKIHQNKIRSLGVVKSGITSFKSAQKNKNEVLPELLFKRKVLEENVRKLEREKRNLSERRNNFLKDRNDLIVKIDALGPEIEVLNTIKKEYSKNVVQSLTVESDIDFEPVRPASQVMKTHSLRKIIVFNIFFSFFFIFFGCVIRNIFDQRIYTEQELEAMCPGLKVLGHGSQIAV